VQSSIIGARTADGAQRVGHKIGLTNPKVQAQLGVDQPDFGVLLDDMRVRSGEPVDITRLLQPKVEAEVAFVLAADLDQPLVTEDDVAAATAHVVAALEIVDSRIADWDVSIVDTIADNGSSGLFVLGSEQVQLDGLDLPSVRMTLRCGADVVSSGSGADCLGNPLTAVAWLANTARDHGAPLQAGDVILSGALGPMVPVTPGSTYSADITAVGHVQVAFTDRDRTNTGATARSGA
jgi:2-keto-4-pentenoate hydratase